MIKMALPNKGQLFEPTLQLLNDCGYKVRKNYKTLSCLDTDNNIEFFFLRPGDIPMYVGQGIIDLGITGLDFNEEKGAIAQPVLPLNFGHSRLCAAVPNESEYHTLDQIQDLRIATSFTGIVSRFFQRNDLKLIELEGAVEISVNLGISDAVVDIVETGSTLKAAGLRIIGEELYRSQAAIFAHPGKEQIPEVLTLKKRIEGHLVAQEHLMVEYDAPKNILEDACQLTPGIESPTVSTLKDPEWFAVKAMIKKSEAARIMDSLSALGCKGIVTMSIQSARI